MSSTVKPNCAVSLVFSLLLGLCAAPLQAGAVLERGAVLNESLQPPGKSLQLGKGPQLEYANPRYTRAQGKKGISRDRAAAIVKQRYGGKILAVSETNKGGRSVYRVKGLSDKSQVYVVYVDKQSGRISR